MNRLSDMNMKQITDRLAKMIVHEFKSQVNPKKHCGVFSTPVKFWLISSEVESFSTRNFGTFLILNVELGKNKKFLKFASWVT